MRTFSTVATVVLAAAVPASASPDLRQATHPSFSCDLAKTSVERAICASATLSGLDLSLESVFRKALSSHRESREDLLGAQRQWLASRGPNCGMSADAPATSKQTERLVTLYTQRISGLSGGTLIDLGRPKQVKTFRVEPDGSIKTR